MDISVTRFRANCLDIIRRVEAAREAIDIKHRGKVGALRGVSVTVLLFAAPAAATLFLACSGGTPTEDAGAPTSAVPITAVQAAPATTSAAAASAAATATTSEDPASSASATATATATLAADPEYTIQQLGKCCTALAAQDRGRVLPPRAAVIQGCKGYVELARRGEKTPLQGLKELHRLHTAWPQECNLPQGAPAR